MKEKESKELSILTSYINQHPKNKRRSRNKIVLENDSFELRFDVVNEKLEIARKEDLYFSIIPYDTSRKYVETASFIYIESPEYIDEYLKRHEKTILQYIKIALFERHQKRYDENSPEVLKEVEMIQEDIYFKIQIAGRLMQHDETGPLSAALPFKFLYDLNIRTGIHGFIDELIRFFLTQVRQLPLVIGDRNRFYLEDGVEGHSLIDEKVNYLMVSNVGVTRKLSRKMLTKEQNNQIKEMRRTYKAHSKHPKEIQHFFEDISDHSTTNSINVVSDIHSVTGEIPLKSPGFNIIAGDLADGVSGTFTSNTELSGIGVIGNHDILNFIKESNEEFDKELFDALVNTTDRDYSVLKWNDTLLYQRVKTYLEDRYQGLEFLNNEVYHYENIRYIGLTLPICYIKERKKAQLFIGKILKELLGEDKKTPTVIISHAPLFNELSLLSPKSSSYHKDFTCQNKEIADLFREYHILGVIHGHHHIPASSGVIDKRYYQEKELFVVCSIFSNLNSGFDLSSYVDRE